MKKEFKLGFLSILFSGLFFTACQSYPDESDYITEQLASITAYDTAVKFTGPGAQFSTYAIAQNVVFVNDGDTVQIPITDSRVSGFVASIRDKMSQYLGYQEITDGTTMPNMGIVITAVESENYIIDYYNPYWWDCDYYWYYWWDCGYYPYYPYPYYPAVVGSYTTGTAFINMIDLTGGTQQKEVVWTGMIRSLLLNNHSSAEIDQAVDDCFRQTLAF